MLEEGEEVLLDRCHYSSPWSYVMVSWHWLWPDLAIAATGSLLQHYMAQQLLLGHIAWRSLLAEVTHPSPTYRTVLLTFLVSLSPAVAVSHSLLVLLGLVTRVRAGRPYRQPKLNSLHATKYSLCGSHIMFRLSKTSSGLSKRQDRPQPAKGAEWLCHSQLQPGAAAFSTPCPRQSTATGHRA